MLKKDLINLISGLKDEDEVDEILKTSELVKKFSDLEVFKSKLNEPDFKSFIDSEKDKHLTKGIETFKTNNLSKLVDEKVKELYPEADPKDTELAKMKKIVEQMQKDTNKKELTNKALKLAQEKKLPVELIDFLVADDEENTTKNINILGDIFAKRDETIKKELLKDNSYVPPKGGSDFTKNPWSKDHFNLTEQGKILKENPELAKKYMYEK
jgi:hypothetical protein